MGSGNAMKARVIVTLKPGVLDPQGKAVEHSIVSLGYNNVTDTRIGKYIELKLNASSQDEAKRITDEVCKKLLANPVIEDYEFEVTSLNGTNHK